MPCLILTTTGRKRHQSRAIALAYARDGDRYMLAASNDARASSSGPLARYWELLNAVSDGRYDRYQARTARRIPVVVIE